ncbi:MULTISPECIES: 50S ribosomal protein L25/general stress protein Ctc [Mesoflavibacter]|uniref:Large ribosomal subunit protein bL25 n=1 Tax=Mesoflavibacter zeaxanthinifaciens subsp. sabulilitoris TaxID=1520893 RepID=A0A2T1NI54_9FLAO|nr:MULTISPECIES: 50S ribosomal protein L25/general stress protein Ctc [Mesoflavibacter]MBB3124290.1 large subunit ribosomal protein L25 [Mesoflavibacter zeaxanthinifaciens subsp. sabulilitoris]MCP4054751.1 50S ribosomal protein L25/general stress protein Ctc [Mesoflavibacter sp.]PSG92607.1 50S ribosomal protein L25 [Mesoflavibacter zeaxanthinifaciens subsp. sabulilitoris]UAB76675.1 50S ribosomal protein L25/general stress protein Ctc [Mesoflavibacter sp. SCSIO 43206]|tara:strand:+ start:490 stop:1122 length:633 start_codon:yes stop_codon:yes gene_type:complete
MKSITINGSQRESVGKKATKALRNAGQVPCVLYGGDNPVHFSAPELAFSKLVYTPNAHTVVIELENGDTYNAILQDIQFHPVTDNILHIDFYQLFDNKEVTMEIPVQFTGNSRGVRNGGVLRKNKRSLRVKALPGNLPDYIEADITDLKIGNKLYITALDSEDFKFMHPDNTVVCQVRRSRASMAVADDDEDEDEDVPATETDDVAAVKE